MKKKRLKDMLIDRPEEKKPLPMPIKQDTPEEIQAKDIEERKARSAACLKEVAATLEKYRCYIRTEPVIEAGLVKVMWGVDANE